MTATTGNRGRSQAARAIRCATESLYGSDVGIAASVAIPFISHSIVEDEIGSPRGSEIGFGNLPGRAQNQAKNVGGQLVTPSDINTATLLLESLMPGHTATAYGGGGYIHQFVSPYIDSSGVPQAGTYGSLQLDIGDLMSCLAQIHTGCVITNFELSLNRESEVRFSWGIIAKHRGTQSNWDTDPNDEHLPTPTNRQSCKLENSRIWVAFDGRADGNVISGRVSYNTNGTRFAPLTDDGEISGVSYGTLAVEGELVIRDGSTLDRLEQIQRRDGRVAITIGIPAVGNKPYGFQFDILSARLAPINRPISGGSGLDVSVSFMADVDVSGQFVGSFNKVAHAADPSNATFLAIGQRGAVQKSTDNGASWTKQAITISGTDIVSHLTALCNDGTDFVVGTMDGRIYYSSDAVTWHEGWVDGGHPSRTDGGAVRPTGTRITSIVYSTSGSGRFIYACSGGVVGGGSVYGPGESLSGRIKYGDAKQTATAMPGNVKVSSNFSTIRKLLVNPSTQSTILAVGDNGLIAKSTDTAATWTEVSVTGAGSYDFKAAAYGNSVYVIAGTYGAIYTSADLATWTKRTQANNFTGTWLSCEYVGTKFILVGTNGEVQTSTDGTTWTHIEMGSDTQQILSAVTGDASHAVIVGTGGAIETAAVSDLTAWTARSAASGYPKYLATISIINGYST